MKSCPLGGGRDQEIEVTLWKAASELFHRLEPTTATEPSAAFWISTSLSTLRSKHY